MAINALWNRRSGPGGGTRRLHHSGLRLCRALRRGRNRIDARSKDMVFARHDSAVIGSILQVPTTMLTLVKLRWLPNLRLRMISSL